jgi:hypothetical protein
MIIRKITFCLLLQLCVFIIHAQQINNKNSWQLHSINQVGLVETDYGTAFQLQTINGFQYKNFFSGIGIGLDYYKVRSIPLFVDVRKYFGTNRNAFFVYENAGVNFAWEKEDPVTEGSSYHYNTGFYNDVGLGYRIAMKNKISILLSGGYSYKRISENQSSNICPFVGPCYEQRDKYVYDLSRLIFKIGLLF